MAGSRSQLRLLSAGLSTGRGEASGLIWLNSSPKKHADRPPKLLLRKPVVEGCEKLNRRCPDSYCAETRFRRASEPRPTHRLRILTAAEQGSGLWSGHPEGGRGWFFQTALATRLGQAWVKAPVVLGLREWQKQAERPVAWPLSAGLLVPGVEEAAPGRPFGLGPEEPPALPARRPAPRHSSRRTYVPPHTDTPAPLW